MGRLALGCTLAFTIEPDERWGRLVGIRKGADVPPIRRLIVREFRDGDGAWPTGGYRTVAPVFALPYDEGSD
jgi:hypothetical protein